MTGKMARACDCCLRKRAKWYCLADDAFLCQSCDGSVHSANPFAQRHDRVRLKMTSLRPEGAHLPSWHRGPTCKARTPRHGKSGQLKSKSGDSLGLNLNRLHTVPELGIEETTSSHDDETDDKILYRVPSFDPFVSELCSSTSTSEEGSAVMMSQMMRSSHDEHMPSDLYLEEFAADVETLLGKGLDDESCGIEELGLLNDKENNNNNNNTNDNNNTPIDFFKSVKEENNFMDSTMGGEDADGAIRETFDFSFDSYDDDHDHDHGHRMMVCKDDQVDDHEKGGLMIDENYSLCKIKGEEEREEEEMKKRRKIILRLNYEAISEAWASQGSPWMNGQRPQINPDDCWPHFMGTCRGQIMHHPCINTEQEMGVHGVNGDGGREARVSRYREKRRTRLFAKKIRYEVRKLNAEKRPRMKGRFVKRSSFAPNASSK